MGSSKFKIAYFQQDGQITGSAISLRHFLSAINRDEFEPVVIMAKEGPARMLYEALNIAVHVHPFRTYWTFPGPACVSREMLWQLPALLPDPALKKYILNTIKPDLVHINDKAALNVGVSLGSSPIPVIQHSRSSYYITACKLSARMSRSKIGGFADHIICISEDEQDGFESFPDVSVIYNTVDFSLVNNAAKNRSVTRNSFGITDQDVLIGFAASINQKKGAWDFLEIAKALKNEPGIKFMMVGHAPDTGSTLLAENNIINKPPAAYLEAFITAHQLQDRFILTGFRKDSLDLIAAMDLLVVPNKNGVLGRQPIEAQALGTRVVAYNGHSGRSKIIQHGKTGYLVNNLSEAIQAIKNALADPGQQMKEDARAHALSSFSPAKNMQQIESIYRKYLPH